MRLRPLPPRKPSPDPEPTRPLRPASNATARVWGQEAASVQALRLRCAEFEELRAADAAEIRRLGIKLRRLEAAARTATATKVEIRTPGARYGRRAAARPRSSSATPWRCSAGATAWVRVEGAVTARLGPVPRGERRHPAAGRTPHSAAFSLHPLGHESPAAGDRPGRIRTRGSSIRST